MGINKNKEILYIKLEKKDGQNFIKFIQKNLKKTPIINHKFKILRENENVLFPIFEHQGVLDKLADLEENQINFEFITKEGVPNVNYKYRTLQEVLVGKISDKYLDLIPKSYDIIGDIAVIEFDKFNELNDKKASDYKEKVAEGIIDINKNVKTVYEKKSQIKGKYRLRELAHLYGKDKYETIHKENDCFFKLDIKNTFFSPRLVFERQRISSSKIEQNEIIIDMFSGVGTFAIQIAKKNKVKVYAFDVNPNAYRYLKENIKLNKIIGDVIPHNINIKELFELPNQLGQLLFHKADRVIMNLPENSIKFVDVACFLMKKSGGILHFYQFSEKPNPIEKTLKSIELNLANINWEIENIINSKIVKHYSPRSELVVVDLKIKSMK
ncbi:MAG: class I SAM-dependent methyltransferase family protein [Candidatus Hodarchaeota archaeon]